MIEAAVGILKWLGGLLFKSRAASRAHSRDHDIALFQREDAIVNEFLLGNLLNGNLYNRWCWLADIRAVHYFCQNLEREENQFLDHKVKKSALNAIQKVAAVDSFVGIYFFPVNDGDKLRLYPEWQHSDDEELRHGYQRYVQELNPLLAVAWTAYRQYRATVRDRLKV